MKSRALKRLLKHPRTQSALAALVAGYIRLVMASARMTKDISPEAMPFVTGEAQGIYAFWHGRLFLCSSFIPKKRRMHVLISGHRDGVLISKVIAHFNIATVEGSTSKGSLGALRELLRLAKTGDSIAITPDGPRGPREESAPGVAYLAKATSLPVIPVAWSAAKHRRLSSWDRFMLPCPFSRISQVVGAPLKLGGELSDEEARGQVTRALRDVTERADTLMGVALC